MSIFHLGFWNLENLFAPEGHAARSDWLARRLASELRGWSPEVFAAKIDRLAGVAAAMNGGAGPDLLGVCEVENRFCLDAFCAALNLRLPARAYLPVHADSEADKRGIDTAFVMDSARLTCDSATVFNHRVIRRTGTRDIVQATFRAASGSEVVVMCNHWPSRSGGAEASAGFRMAAGETLGYFHERVREILGPEVAVVALGDFNDDPWDLSLTRHANATREREDVSAARSARFYNLGWGLARGRLVNRLGRSREVFGTIYYGGDGFAFDQIMVSPGLLRTNGRFELLDDAMRIEAPQDIVSSSKNEGPIRFGRPSERGDSRLNPEGASDHFPVSIRIRDKS